MAYWTIIGTGIEGDLQGKTFGVTLDTNNKKWTASGPSVAFFFVTKSGEFNIAGVPENGAQLVSAAKKEVAFLKALNGTTSVGATGGGRASEKGVNFTWKLDSK